MRAAAALVVALASISLVAGAGACSSDGGSSSSSGTAGDAGAGAQCASSATFLECRICCGITDSYIQGQTALEDCLCDEACKTECETNGCSTAPNAPAATPACVACVESDKAGQQCTPKAQAICDQDPACKQFQACSLAAKCSDKPDDVDGG